MIPTNTDTESARNQRLRDALRLAQSRQQNLEENIKRLHSLQDKLYRHQKLTSDLDIDMKRMYALNKEYASLSEEAARMERFETFESIMAPFLEMQMLNVRIEESRHAAQKLEQQIRAVGNRMDETAKQLSASLDAISLAEAQHQELCAKVEECGQHDGACAILEENIRALERRLLAEEDTEKDIDNKVRNAKGAISDMEHRLETLSSRRHVLESHENMLEKGDVILGMLHRLEEMADNLQKKVQQLNRNNEEQILAHEELLRIQSVHTNIEQKIQSLQDEINIHRLNIRDKQTYEVQGRVMDLKSRILMLSAAASLWSRISSGYQNIEDKTQLLNSLRLDIEHDMKAEQNLTITVNTLRRQVTDKQYTLNMSKSQSLISLRADLQEGTACSVCGAKHHPYHSDTMQDQYKLISDFQSELEVLSGELQGQERQLSALHDNLTRNIGQQTAEQANLDAILLRQESDVKEWKVFAHLDPTFADCSPSIDGDMRMSSIRQLTDNARRDLQRAEEELSELNYHTSQITSLSAKIAELENRKTETWQQANEAGAQCSILAASTSRLDSSRKLAQEKYHLQYEMLLKEITIQEWYKLWQKSPESLYLDIRKMMADWKEINSDMAVTAQALSEERIRCGMYESMLAPCIQNIEDIKENIRKQKSKAGELSARRQQLLQKDSIGAVLDHSLNGYRRALDSHELYVRQLQEQALEKMEKEGAYGCVQQTYDEAEAKAMELRNMVDMWIRTYNTDHTPIQYAELQEVLTQDTDWNVERNTIRENQLAVSLQQQKVKALQSEIIALETDTGPLTAAQLHDKQLATETQIQQNEASLREVNMQIARLQLELGLQ